MKSKVRSSLSWFLSILLVLTMMPAMGLTASATTSSLNVGVVWTVNDETVDSIPVEYTNGGILTAEVVGGESTYTYAWYETTTEVADLDAFEELNPQELTNSNENKWTYNVGDSLTVGPHYFVCKVTDNNATSLVGIGKATVTVAPAAPTIAGQLSDLNLEVNASTENTLSVTVSNATVISEAGGTLSFNWYENSNASNIDSTDTNELEPIPVTTGVGSENGTSTLTVPTTTAGTKYYFCEITNTQSSITNSTKSNIATVTVRPAGASDVSFTINNSAGTEVTGAYGNVIMNVTATVADAGDVTFNVYNMANSGATNPEGLTALNSSPIEMEQAEPEGPYTGSFILPYGTYGYLFVAVTNSDNEVDSEPVLYPTSYSGASPVTVTKATVTITSKDQVLPVGGTLASTPDSVTVTGLVGEDTLTKVVLSAEWNTANTTIEGQEPSIGVSSTGFEILDADGQNVSEWYQVSTTGTNPGKLTVKDTTPYTVTGHVYSHTTNPTSADALENAKVTLEKGNTIYAGTTTDSDGVYSLRVVEPGTYNLVAVTADGTLTKTEMVTFSGTNSSSWQIIMPDVGEGSVLNTDAAGDLALIVGGLDDVADATNGFVTLTVTTEGHESSMTTEEAALFTTGQSAITSFASDYSAEGLTFLEMTLTDSNGNAITTTPSLLQMRVPFDTSKSNIGVFRWHDDGDGNPESGEVVLMDKLDAAPTLSGNTEGFVVGSETDQFVDVYANKYSTYAIAYNVTAANNDQPAGGGGGGGGRTSGGNAATTPDTPATTEPTTTEPVTTNPTTGTSTTTFTDVKEGAYYAEAVKWAVAAGITNGKTATLFGPDDSCTRAQIVTFIWRAMGSPEPTVSSTAFTDIDAAAYYYKAVLWAVEAGVANGTSATTFSPNATVTRGEAVTFLYRAKGGSLATASTQFTDVDPSAYYAEAVAWAAANGITTGTSATTFSPNEKCTRGQIVTFLYRANN